MKYNKKKNRAKTTRFSGKNAPIIRQKRPDFRAKMSRKMLICSLNPQAKKNKV